MTAIEVSVRGTNSVTTDMQCLYGCYVIEVPKERMVIVKGLWELNNPKEPKSLDLVFLEGDEATEEKWLSFFHPFRDELLGDGFSSFMKLGLETKKGVSLLHAPSGVKDQISIYFARHATKVIKFLEGDDDYKGEDMDYSNSWGSW